MKKIIQARFEELVKRGEELIRQLPRDDNGGIWWCITGDDIPKNQAWLESASNLIRIASGQDSHFNTECEKISYDKTKKGVPSDVVQKVFALLLSAKEEWEHGLLREIEYVIAAATFDDFLDHAEFYHKGNRKIEASVLASAVLEDTLKKIARKNSFDPRGLSLEPLIDDLVKRGVLKPVKAKRIKGFAGVRNHALHAEWDQIDIRDVGE
ncbi:unnamed protein product, partial [marine sediment metagenome]